MGRRKYKTIVNETVYEMTINDSKENGVYVISHGLTKFAGNIFIERGKWTPVSEQTYKTYKQREDYLAGKNNGVREFRFRVNDKEE